MGKTYPNANVLNSVTLPNNATYDLNDVAALHFLGVSTVGITKSGSGAYESTGDSVVINGDTANPVTLVVNDAVTAGGDNVLYQVKAISGTGASAKVTWDCLSPDSATGALTTITINNDDDYVTISGHTADLTINAATIAFDRTTAENNALPDGVTATTQAQTDNSTKLATTAYVRTAVEELPQAMIFRGTLDNHTEESSATIHALPLPTAATAGDVYEVIEAASYSGMDAEVGDLFICAQGGTAQDPTYSWVLIPSGDVPEGTVKSISAGIGLKTADGNPITSSGTVKAALKSETEVVANTTLGTASDRVIAVVAAKTNTASEGQDPVYGPQHLAVAIPAGTLATTVSDVTNDNVVKTIDVAAPAASPSGLAYYEVSGTTLTLKQITTTTANNGVFGTAPTP